jgi:hypothetical protein
MARRGALVMASLRPEGPVAARAYRQANLLQAASQIHIM